MQYLEDHYGNETSKGVDLLWNPTNHRVLDQNDFAQMRQEPYNVQPWEFIQRAVSFPTHC